MHLVQDSSGYHRPLRDTRVVEARRFRCSVGSEFLQSTEEYLIVARVPPVPAIGDADPRRLDQTREQVPIEKRDQVVGKRCSKRTPIAITIGGLSMNEERRKQIDCGCPLCSRGQPGHRFDC